MLKVTTSFIVLLVVALVLTGCGKTGPAAKISVAMTDFSYEPNSWTIVAGKDITLDIQNNGAIKHEFVIMKFGMSAGDSFGDEDNGNVYWKVELEPGESKTVTFTAPADPGDYEVVCGTPGHLQAGMKAKLTVATAP